jgi:hypothetical protein
VLHEPEWKREFREFESNGGLPALSIALLATL